MPIILILLLIIFSSLTFAQIPSPLPSPAQKKVTLKQLKTIHVKAEAKGNDLKALAKPDRKEKISWQKVLVGQQKIDGARLVGLPDSSLWRRIGLQQGDVILHIAGEGVGSEDQLEKALKKVDKRSTIDFKILRDNQMMLIDYKLEW